MLLGSLDELPFRIIALLVGITVHEFSHALIASLLGDLTAKRLGRLTLNPIRHLDPMGTILMFLVGFGWGKPVPVNQLNLNKGRQGMAAVAVAGPIANILVATVAAIPLRFNMLDWFPQHSFNYLATSGIDMFLGTLLVFILVFNVLLAIFNLIPFFPLDGSSVVLGILPHTLSRHFARLERYGPVILMLVIAADFTFRFGILWSIIRPMVNYVVHILLGQSLF
jgi:Zn-dependent protease